MDTPQDLEQLLTTCFQTDPQRSTEALREAVSVAMSRIGPGAADSLKSVYREMHARAAAYLRHDRAVLQPTELVHEAYLRLADQSVTKRASRAHFMALAALMMRRVLVDHARDRGRKKRGGGAAPVTLDTSDGVRAESGIDKADALSLHQALDRLELLDARQALVVQLRFFGGMTVPEIAEALGVSVTTVESEWRMARAWLHRELGSNNPSSEG